MKKGASFKPLPKKGSKAYAEIKKTYNKLKGRDGSLVKKRKAQLRKAGAKGLYYGKPVRVPGF